MLLFFGSGTTSAATLVNVVECGVGSSLLFSFKWSRLADCAMCWVYPFSLGLILIPCHFMVSLVVIGGRSYIFQIWLLKFEDSPVGGLGLYCWFFLLCVVSGTSGI